MQIVVTGNKDTTDALVNIEGMNLKEFECLVNVLKEKYRAIEEIYALDNDSRKYILQQTILAQSGKTIELEALESTIQNALESCADQYQLIYKFLKII